MLTAGRYSFEELLAKKELVEGFRIQTNEFLQIRTVIERAAAWR